MIDKLFLSIVITLLLGFFLNTNLLRGMSPQGKWVNSQEAIQNT